MKKLIAKMKLRAEVKAYEKYAKLNRKRKAGSSNRVYQWFDELRRTIGYVK